jgi:chitinase
MKLSLAALAALGSTYKLDQPEHTPLNGNDRPFFCYYTNWSQYRPSHGQFWPEDIPANLCTTIVFSFGYVDNTPNGWGVVPFEWNDQDSAWSDGLYTRINKLKYQNPSLKTALALGGWNHGSTKWTEMVSTDQGIRDFARNSLRYVKTHGFNGLDIDWEYPAKCTIDCSRDGDDLRFKNMYRQLRYEIDNNPEFSGIELTIAVGIGKDKIHVVDGKAPSYDPRDLTDYFDYVHLMSYDMHGHWEDKTGHQAMAHPLAFDDR